VDGDERGFRVALVTDELVNPPSGGLDALAVLEEEGWGVIQLPPSDYPDEITDPLLDQVAEQAEEFARHGYRLAIVGRYEALAGALASRGVAIPPQIDPASVEELRAFLSTGDG
jgi:hypothetical protein